MRQIVYRLTDRACQGAEGAEFEAEDREHRHESTVKVYDPMVRFRAREALAMLNISERGDSDCKGYAE